MTEPVETAAPPRRRRIHPRVVVVAAGAVVVVAAAVFGTLGLGGAAADSAAQPVTSTAVPVPVERRTLVRSVSVDGTIDYGTAVPLSIKATGTITWLPKPGAVIERGEPVLRVDDRPVTLLYGKLPHYRELAAPRRPAPTPEATQTPTTGTSAIGKPATAKPVTAKPAARTAPVPPPFTGNDVRQFESNLRKLGLSGFDVDTSFTGSTERAVKRWQRDLGVPSTGRVGLGDVVYAPGPVRIAKVTARVGAAMSDGVVSVSGETRFVTATAPAKEVEWAKPGLAVTVGSSGGGIAGKVASVGSAAQDVDAPDGQAPAAGAGDSVVVTVSVKDQKALGRQAGGAVSVTYVADKREDVLCVPVTALVALVEGGYGLEPAAGTGGFVAVKTGMFADGFVEVSGPAVREGLTVRMPG